MSYIIPFHLHTLTVHTHAHVQAVTAVITSWKQPCSKVNQPLIMANKHTLTCTFTRIQGGYKLVRSRTYHMQSAHAARTFVCFILFSDFLFLLLFFPPKASTDGQVDAEEVAAISKPEARPRG